MKAPITVERIERRPIHDLIANPQNARLHFEWQIRQIAASITGFGLRESCGRPVAERWKRMLFCIGSRRFAFDFYSKVTELKQDRWRGHSAPSTEKTQAEKSAILIVETRSLYSAVCASET
jgi:hypothetical protein